MKKNYVVLQDGIKECGSACLLSLIRYYGGNISLERLLELTNTNKSGTNFYDITKAAYEVGLVSKGYKIDNIDELFNIDSPFISQIVENYYTHFVVVYKMYNNKITIMDPAKGMVNLTKEEFKKIWTGYILILNPYKKLPEYSQDNYLINIIKNIIISNKKMVINLLSITILTTIFTCIYSYHFKILIDNYLYTNKLSIIIITIIFIIILAIKIITEYLRNNLLLYLNQKIDLSIITKTIKKIISLPYNYYKNKTTGETISRINDLLSIKNVVSKTITTIFLDIILSIVVLIVLFAINKTMTTILFIIIITYFLIFFAYKNIIKIKTNTIQENNAKVNSLLVESISSYETIKGLNLENKFQNKINKEYLKTINNNLELTRIINSENLIKDLFEGIIILFIIYLGITYVMDKSLTIGSLITYDSLLYYFIIPIRNSLEFYKEFYYTKNSIKRINNLFDYKYEQLDKESNLNINGDILINDLEFSYNGKNKILKGINLVIPKESKVLILGSSGSGKSTLLKILYKYYEIGRNNIYINNYDLLDYKLKDIRSNITYISQNEFLYTDTIRNNIILDRCITEKEFIDVCKLTYIDEIVNDNILSYDFRLEENGANISGGQRQRIILARALLKKSKIILIDEGLNEIDIDLERKILKNIFENYKNKIIIIVSHRLNNLDLYDKVIKLEEGKIMNVIARNG